MLRFLLTITAILILTPLTGFAQTSLNGSGASFPYQIYSLWFMLTNQLHKDVHVEYLAKGSGGGIKDFIDHRVDFAASDAAMNEKEIAAVPEGVQLLPMTAGEVVLAYNLKNIKSLNLPRAVYPQIFLGRITKWNDPAIADANPSVELPDLDITVVTRADSSGTTFVFTKHLSTISQDFKNGPGFGKKVKWPQQNNFEKIRLNLGISATVQEIPGSIGYLDYGFASLAKLQMANLENKVGHFIPPGLAGGQAALANVKLPESLIAWLSDPDGAESYPIATYTWMMFYKRYKDPKKAEAARKMIELCLTTGQKISSRVGYIPLPKKVVERVRAGSMNIQ